MHKTKSFFLNTFLHTSNSEQKLEQTKNSTKLLSKSWCEGNDIPHDYDPFLNSNLPSLGQVITIIPRRKSVDDDKKSDINTRDHNNIKLDPASLLESSQAATSTAPSQVEEQKSEGLQDNVPAKPTHYNYDHSANSKHSLHNRSSSWTSTTTGSKLFTTTTDATSSTCNTTLSSPGEDTQDTRSINALPTDHSKINKNTQYTDNKKGCIHLLKRFINRIYAITIKRYVNLLFMNRAFGMIFISYFFSQIGNWFTEVAGIALVQMITTTHYPQYSGILLVSLYICAFLPAILLMPVTGVVSDTLDRRKIMLLCDFSRVFVAALFIIPAIFQTQLFGLFYLITFVLYAIKSFYEPARESLYPFILKNKHQYVTANALIAMNGMVCASIGSSLGGYLMTATNVGAIANFSIDAVTFVFSAAICLSLFCFKSLGKSNDSHEQKEIQNTIGSIATFVKFVCSFPVLFGKYWKEVLLCTRYLSKNPYIFSITTLKGIGAINYGAVEILMIKYSTTNFVNIFSGDVAGLTMFGISKAIYGIMTGMSPFIVERLLSKNARPWSLRLIIMLNFLGVVLGYVLIYFSLSHYMLFFFGVSLIGCAYGNVWAFSMALLQAFADPTYLGRLIALDIGFFLNVLQTCSFIGTGLLIDFLQFDAEMLCLMQICIGALTFLIITLWFFLSFKFDPSNKNVCESSTSNNEEKELQQFTATLEKTNKFHSSPSILSKNYDKSVQSDVLDVSKCNIEVLPLYRSSFGSFFIGSSMIYQLVRTYSLVTDNERNIFVRRDIGEQIDASKSLDGLACTNPNDGTNVKNYVQYLSSSMNVINPGKRIISNPNLVAPSSPSISQARRNAARVNSEHTSSSQTIKQSITVSKLKNCTNTNKSKSPSDKSDSLGDGVSRKGSTLSSDNQTESSILNDGSFLLMNSDLISISENKEIESQGTEGIGRATLRSVRSEEFIPSTVYAGNYPRKTLESNAQFSHHNHDGISDEEKNNRRHEHFKSISIDFYPRQSNPTNMIPTQSSQQEKFRRIISLSAKNHENK